MPRNAQGIFTLDPSNPVAPDTVISTIWANPTMEDIGDEITNSLDRDGRGGMNAPLLLEDGTEFAPAITFRLQPTVGFYRPLENVLAMVINSAEIMRWSVGGASITGELTVGSLTISDGQIFAQDGTAALPGISFVGAPDTGFQRTASAEFMVINGAIATMVFRANRDVEILGGVLRVNSLAGTGTRNVVVDAQGIMSAP